VSTNLNKKMKQKQTSIVPAISMWAHFISGSSLSLGLAPSAKALRNSAAVHEPAGLPPVYEMKVLSG
jgi:hypothetical protein